MKAARVLLIGMMGAGKSSVGRAISQRTGWPYRDNDDMVAELTGLPTAALLEQRGEPALRAAESAALDRALTVVEPIVAGVAGGVVDSEDDRARLREAQALVVYLHTPVEVLVRRVGAGKGRPWLEPDPATALRRLYAGREPLYREVADLVVETDAGDAHSHAMQVLAALEA